ncbi:hypothetical protein SAMN02910409_2026 [Prevotellaceae bacterium HUN156]|nr:hypothetical protein SAMN02910409_2026 [Prevotellaceae bacterium HUN156]
MKQILLSLVLLFCVGSAFGQTPSKLIKKYKAISGMQYQNITDSIKNLKEADDPQRYKITRGVTKIEFVFGVLSEDEQEELQQDMDGLKGFKRVFYEKHNSNEGPLSMFKGTFKIFKQTQYYAIEDGDHLKEMVARIDLDVDAGQMVLLVHIKGKIKQEDVADMIQMEESSDVNVKEEERNENILIVINGQEYPSLNSAHEAAEWMNAKGISINHTNMIIGAEEVKKKYPHSDKKVAIEYSRTDAQEDKKQK